MPSLCLVHPVDKTLTNVERREVYLAPRLHSFMREVRAGAESETTEEDCLLACSACFLDSSGPPPRRWQCPRGLCALPQQLPSGNAPQTCCQAIVVEAVSPLPRVSKMLTAWVSEQRVCSDGTPTFHCSVVLHYPALAGLTCHTVLSLTFRCPNTGELTLKSSLPGCRGHTPPQQ